MQISIDKNDTQSIAEAVASIMMPFFKELFAKQTTAASDAGTLSSKVRTTGDNDLLDQAQVAQMIFMSEAWLEKKRCAGGGIAFVKVGSNVRYRRKDVIDYINRRTFRNTCEATKDPFEDD